MIQSNKPLTQEELEIGSELYNRRIEYLIQLGEIKLSEIQNERILEDLYFSITELNTKENLFRENMERKYGKGQVDLVNKIYVKGM